LAVQPTAVTKDNSHVAGRGRLPTSESGYVRLIIVPVVSAG
jgi:hypothetical protein